MRWSTPERVEQYPRLLTQARASEVRESFKAGDVFADRYRMVARIGQGGMAEVWQADDLLLRAPIALKLIHSRSAEARRHVINEVKLARQITHPAVCRVFDVGEAGDTVFYSMELVREDLQALLKRVGRLSPEKVIDIAHQLCAGLAAAHAKGVLHRDLKPANVLIDDDGRVRIADFGIAVTRAEGERPGLAGTPDYMAPEQKDPGGPVTEQTDLYALGMVLYELTTGQHPFGRAAGSSRLVKPSALVRDVDPQLERALVKVLAPRAANRPVSAAAFAASLPEAGRPPHLMPTMASAVLRRPKTRPWLLDRRVSAIFRWSPTSVD
jgi:serine/threonine protein kinase